MLVSEKEVEESLKPYFDDMVRLVNSAFTDWLQSPFAASMQDAKVRANVIWNQFLYHAKAHFDTDSVVRVESMSHWSGLVVDSKYFIRMKKAGPKMLSRNYPTRSAVAFNDASVDLFDGVARLELIYGLDNLGTAVDKIVLVQRHRNQILWALDLLRLTDSTKQAVIPMPVQPPTSAPATRVIKPKRAQTAAPKTGTKDGKQ